MAKGKARGKQIKKLIEVTQKVKTKPRFHTDDEDDDGYPWFGCVCGSTHDTFWIQCDSCNAWFNVSPQCLGYDERESRRRGTWQCPCCSSSAEKGGKATLLKDLKSSPQHHDQHDKNRDRMNQEEKVKSDHPVYSKNIELLDNSELLGPHNVLTERSITVCARLIMYYLAREHERSDFQKELWSFLWNCLRYEQKLNGWQGGWNRHLGEGTSGIPYYYIPQKSPHSNGKENFEFFTSKESVVAYLCVVIKDVDNNAFDSLGRNEIEMFQSRLLEANDQHTSYDIIRRFHSLSTPSSLPGRKKRSRQNDVGLNSIINITNKQQRLQQNDKQVNEVEITRVNQELLNAIATSDMNKCESLCAKDMISYQQKIDHEEVKGGLVRGIAQNDTGRKSYKSTKYDSDLYRRNIHMTDRFVEFQGVCNDVAVLSYTRHDVYGDLDKISRKEIRIWTKKNNSWINTFTSTFPST